MELLLDAGADVGAMDDDGQTALAMASTEGKANAARLLLQRGADVEAKDCHGKTPLIKAASRGSVMVAAVLLQWGSDPQAKDSVCLASLGRSGHAVAQRRHVVGTCASGVFVPLLQLHSF